MANGTGPSPLGERVDAAEQKLVELDRKLERAATRSLNIVTVSSAILGVLRETSVRGKTDRS